MHSPNSTAIEQLLPTAVHHALQAANITFSLHPSHSIDPAQRLYAMFLHHAEQQALVIIPRNHVLDLNRLNALTKRQWQALAPSANRAQLSRYGLVTLPALPSLFKLPCLYSAALPTSETIYLDAGVDNLVIGLSSAALSMLLSDAQALACSDPIAPQHPNHSAASNDVNEIEKAVLNLTSRRIQKRLEETLEIPLLSNTAKNILRLRTDPLAQVGDLAAIVETDPALAAQVISWATSSYYATALKIRSVEDAIVRVLGFDLVLNLALSLSLGKHLTLPTEPSQSSSTPYWQKAMYTAALIEGLVRLMPTQHRPESGLAYLAGLLHNFGFALLAHIFPPHFSLLCRTLDANQHLNHSLVEHYLFGITREQMGAWLMQCWNIPNELVYALRYQDNPNYQDTHANYANLICLAQHLLAQHNIGSASRTPIPETLYQRLGIEPTAAQQALQRVLDAEQALRQLAAQFNQA